MTTHATLARPFTSHAPAGRPDRRGWRRVGLGVTGVTASFLVFDAVIHLMEIRPVLDSFARLGFDVGVARGIGLVELACVALYLVPRTSVLGAVLLTGYLGGAVSAQLRIDAPVLSTLLFPVYVGVGVWAGLFLRDAQLRRLFPLRRDER